jgi:hypothetical protein
MFVHTIYESRAHTRISEHDISQISDSAMRNNIKHGLTSFMYFDNWRFLQIIEGRPASVADAMQRIADNPMHHSLKVRLMNRSSVRNFEGWAFGAISNDDFELRRVVKNMGYKDLLQTNVLDTIKVLKRTAGRKYRTMNALEKQTMSDPQLVKTPKNTVSLTEAVLGLRS